MKGSVPVLLKFALQRGEGEKREGMKIAKQSTQNLSYQNIVTGGRFPRFSYFDNN